MNKELRIYQYACFGKSCQRCEELLPGFISKQKGRLMISAKFEKKNIEIITAMLEECPSSALSFDAIRGDK